MKVLITGGFGYLGGRLGQLLGTEARHEIILGSRQQSVQPPWLSRGKIVETLWSASQALEGICSGVDVIVHLAGMNAQDCADDPVAALEVNAIATARLLQAAIRKGVKRFIYISTAHVYGSPLIGDISEESCPVPRHPYATSHRAGEDVVLAAHQRAEIEGVVIRLSNAYGAPVHKDANCWMLLVNDLCRQGVTTQRMMLRSSGIQRRDFVTMIDACKAIRHLLELPANRLGDGLFNVGGGWAPTIAEMTQLVAERIHRIAGVRPEILCGEIKGSENSNALDYGIRKLIGTGFVSDEFSNIEREVDGLIRFCMEEFA